MKYPLSIYVLWHPDNYQGFEYANTIFSTFSRNVQHPLQRGIGIPTYFISNPKNLMETINWEEAEQTCLLFFIDEHMIIDDAPLKWEQEVLAIYNHCHKNQNKTLFYPIATYEQASQFSTKLNISNRLNLYDFESQEKEDELLLQIAFKLSTRLYPLKNNERELPVTVFISHARQDGSNLALLVKETIDKLRFGLTSFIDVKDIGKGEHFEKEINSAITESIFLVLNTDEYSSREWCIKEILYAKQHHCPIVHVNATKNHTKRVFPYLGNFPSVKLQITETGNSNIKEIIATVLLETLRFKYHKKLNKNIVSQSNNDIIKNYQSLALPPELLILNQDNQKQLLLYPDPPLGNEELSILRAKKPNIEFTTPMLYMSQTLVQEVYNENFLNNKTIGLSISENPNLVKGGYQLFDHLHLQDALVEISRYLLVTGANCAYGGDINYSKELNFTNILSELIASYREDYQDNITPIINHVFYPISEFVKKDIHIRSKYKGIIDFKFHENPLTHPFSDLESPEAAISLTYMRKKMFEQNDAQIFIAGKIRGYKGLISGILEEAYWALKYQRPIYIVGAFGGISAALIQLFEGKESPLIQEDSLENYQNEHWNQKYTTYQKYAQELWQEDKQVLKDRIHYDSLSKFFASYWKQNDNNLNNGLSPKENQILFTSNNLLEVTRLILKGLNIFFNPNK